MTSQTVAHKSPNRIAQYWALTKPRVTQLAVFCAIIGMFLATDGFPGWKVLIAGTIGIWLLSGAAFAVNCLVEAEIDARMAAPPDGHGRADAHANHHLFRHHRRPRHAGAVHASQSAHHVADVRHLCRLCGHLHDDPETGHAAKHRHWRPVRRHAAGAGLGGSGQRRADAGLAAGADHLCVDAAAFLGAGDVPE
jgi:hypothetical protein